MRGDRLKCYESLRKRKVKKKKKRVITFSPINYQPLLTCPHERSKESIQLPTLHIFPPSICLIRGNT
jgi:hypothetical protein